MKQIKNVIKVKKHGENSLLKFTLKYGIVQYKYLKDFYHHALH